LRPTIFYAFEYSQRKTSTSKLPEPLTIKSQTATKEKMRNLHAMEMLKRLA
jgi:hypothetical protein